MQWVLKKKGSLAEPLEESGWQAISLSLSTTAITSSLHPRHF
jgi:hypothetical protein